MAIELLVGNGFRTSEIVQWLRQNFPATSNSQGNPCTFKIYAAKLKVYTWKATLFLPKGRDRYSNGWVDIGTEYIKKISIDTDTKVLLINDWMAFQLG